jgi:molybdenum cofactor cytidylyltransferase
MANNAGIVILAGGSSSRLGQPKQLLPYNNTTLLKNTINAAVQVPDCEVLVVLGAQHEAIKMHLDLDAIHLSINDNWESGMASSLVKGLQGLLSLSPDIQCCIISVCDQPFIEGSVFNGLFSEYFKTQKGIIASSYAGTFGTPVLFDKKYFPALIKLRGKEGAKSIMTQPLDDMAAVPFENGHVDIDTMTDYNRLTNSI